MAATDDRDDATAKVGPPEQPPDKNRSAVSQTFAGSDESSVSPSDQTAILKDDPATAKLIDGRFVIERELGRGGFGVTYLAADLRNNRTPVVIKALLQQPDGKTRKWVEHHFRQEVKALSRINHPGVVKLVGSGEMLDGRPYLAMEFVEGYELRSQIEPEKGLGDFERIARIVGELGEAISTAHDQGVYHRDLKPENIMLYKQRSGDAEEEHVKVIDFGISTVKESLDEKTRATVLAGSVRYMAPEQLQGAPSASSDIYTLGVIAYEMITGRTPFNPDLQQPFAAMSQLLEMQRAGVRVKPKDLRPSLASAAQDVILKALAFNPSDRYQRAEAFGSDLAKALMATEEQPAVAAQDRPATLEMAYVLFTDIVGYSKLPMDRQTQYLQQLQSVVRTTSAFRQAQASDRLISLPTGDGMALAFFGDPMAAVQCAVEVSSELRQNPHIALRMGVHTGLVYHVADINANRNVAGGGINIAQRVMDCGDAGHILVSQNVADMLSQLSEWQEHLHDLGVHTVKHGVQVHLFNLYTNEVGNPEIPEKLRPTASGSQHAVGHIKPEPVAPRQVTEKVTATKLRVPLILSAVGALLVAAALVIFGWRYIVGSGESDAGRNQNATIKSEPEQQERTLSYWGELQQYRGGKPVGDVTKLTGGIAGETYFSKDDGIRFKVTSSDEGHLYLINEEAEARGASYNILFPSPEANGGSSEVRANREVATSECVFDTKAGTQKVWIVWSADGIAELENAVRRWTNEKDLGEIKDAGTADFVRRMLEQNAGTKLQVQQDEANERMRVLGKGNILVHLLKLKQR